MKYKRIHRAFFIERPNRFIAYVMYNGRKEKVHVKNTGRCAELLVPDAPVYIQESDNPARKTRWDLIAVEKGKRLINMDSQIPNKVVFYGVESEIYKNRVHEVSDAPYCIHCKTEYVYDYVTYGHLGGFRCPNCGYHRPDTQVAVEKVLKSNADASEIEIRIGSRHYKAVINLPGGYNIYNAVATVAAGKVMGLEDSVLIEALNSFECGFGRMEKFSIEGTDIRMILIKNPAGCNQVLNFLSNTSEPSLFVVALNDRYADGTDISWIWDVDFEKLVNISENLTEIWVTGRRADEMALRFKYAGLSLDKIRVIKDYDHLLEAMVLQNAPVYIMPTYTAMLDIREKFSKKFGYKEFWE